MLLLNSSQLFRLTIIGRENMVGERLSFRIPENRPKRRSLLTTVETVEEHDREIRQTSRGRSIQTRSPGRAFFTDDWPFNDVHVPHDLAPAAFAAIRALLFGAGVSFPSMTVMLSLVINNQSDQTMS